MDATSSSRNHCPAACNAGNGLVDPHIVVALVCPQIGYTASARICTRIRTEHTVCKLEFAQARALASSRSSACKPDHAPRLE